MNTECLDTSVCVNISKIGINQTVQTIHELSVYPNPNFGVFTVQSSSPGLYFIIDETGRTMQVFELTSANKNSFNIENLSAGVYFIVGYNEKRMTNRKVVVIK